jgi:hypothetical protein
MTLSITIRKGNTQYNGISTTVNNATLTVTALGIIINKAAFIKMILILTNLRITIRKCTTHHNNIQHNNTQHNSDRTQHSS